MKTFLESTYSLITFWYALRREGEKFLEEMEKKSKNLMDEEAALREQLEAPQQETDETGLQEDVHMTEQWTGVPISNNTVNMHP